MKPFLKFALRGLLVLCCLVATHHVSAQERLCRFDYPNSRGTEITIHNVFGHTPSWGYMPVRITVKNGSAKARTWHLQFASLDNNYNEKLNLTSDFILSSGPLSEGTHEILVPLAPLLGNSNRQQIEVSVSTAGLPSRSDSYYGQFSKDWPCIAISEDLATNNLAKLDNKVKSTITPSYANEFFGLSFKSAQLPKDWRGLVGLDALMITDKEWRKLDPGIRLAVLQWNRMGGQLHLYTATKSTTLDELGFTAAAEPSPKTTNESAEASPAAGGNANAKNRKPGAQKKASPSPPTVSRSLGSITLESWDGKDLPDNDTFLKFKPISRKAKSFTDGYISKWRLQTGFGSKDFNRIFILIVLLIFGILVGPVNLWVLAKPGKRHRMFVTTPVLSIGASLIMALVILFDDGIGGNGTRFTAINIEPGADERKAYVFQEQFARTGLLLGRGFELEDAAVLNPVNLKSSGWSQFESGNDRRNSLRIHGQRYDGDWFRSRSEVGHALQLVRSTRARIEKIRTPAGKTPRLFSSLGFNIDQLYYIDEKGLVWKSGAPTGTGKEFALTEADKSELTAWWNQLGDPGSAFLVDKLGRLTSQKDLFFASTTDPGAQPPATGSFIQWKSEPVLVFGHLMEVESPPAPGQQEP